MSSRAHTAGAAIAVLLALLAIAATPAGAAGTAGVGGYVTDADTGLAIGGARVTWSPGDALPATTAPNGRYALAGLPPGSTGTLTIIGPAGWERDVRTPITIPADDLTTQNVPLHRDWAATAGGATATANDESGAAGGAACGSGAALDVDRATGWSASATRPASDPPALTVQLPQAIDVRELVLNPGAACGHDAGTALGRYRVETSPDGTAWTTASEGELTAAQRGTDVVLAPAAGGSGVQFARLVMLSAQDGAAKTIDVRELAVHGAGPNAAPTGSITADTQRNTVNTAVKLRAAFTDPDSSIVRYLWDFDGDGAWDQATLGPAVSHVWAGMGTYHVTVGVRDFRGALGTASMDLWVNDPSIPVEPILQRKPLITFDPAKGIDIDARIACSSACAFTAKFVVSKKMQRKLRLKHRAIRTFKRKTKVAGLGSWTLTLPQSTIKKLRRKHMSKVNVQIWASATDQERRHSSVKRWVTFR